MSTRDRMHRLLTRKQDANGSEEALPKTFELPGSVGRDQVRWIRRMSYILGLIDGSVSSRELSPEIQDFLRDEMVRLIREECARMHEQDHTHTSQDEDDNDEPPWLKFFRSSGE